MAAKKFTWNLDIHNNEETFFISAGMDFEIEPAGYYVQGYTCAHNANNSILMVT